MHESTAGMRSHVGPCLLEALPSEALCMIIDALYKMRDPGLFTWQHCDSLNSAMQTCRAMRLICSGFISSLFACEGDALRRFPRHSAIKNLTLAFGSAEVTAIWLAASHAAAPQRLGGVERVVLRHLIDEGDDVDLTGVFSALALACPAMRSFEMLYAGDILQYPPGIPFPALQELTLWDCNLRDDIFEPNWIPAGLRRLDIHCKVKDKLAAHLARMTNLSDIIISGFSLSTPLALPENCAWRRVQVFDLANNLERVCMLGLIVDLIT